MRTPRASKLVYLLFPLPFILAYILWLYFPAFISRVVGLLGYQPSLEPVSWLWQGSLWLFYTLYVFFAIGLGGFWVLAAWIWGRTREEGVLADYPMVSFVVPAYNKEGYVERCLQSLFENAVEYPGPCEIIVVDDGSEDSTYDVARRFILKNRMLWPNVPCKVVRHCTNLGKVEAVRTGVNKAMGELIATVDADTFWEPSALKELVKQMVRNGKAATTGFIHPSDGGHERNLYVILQQLEYSQWLGIFRRGQALGDAVPVVPGPMGLYRAYCLREVLNGKKLKSVAEDFEITLYMYEDDLKVDYTDRARCTTVAPKSFQSFWRQRIRWYTGWLHNLLSIHRGILFKKSWLGLYMWYTLVLGYGGDLLELTAMFSIPAFLFFAPDKLFFLINLLLYLLLVVGIGTVFQSLALKFSYGEYNHKNRLLYSPFYHTLRIINLFAHLKSLAKYLSGDNGSWKAC